MSVKSTPSSCSEEVIKVQSPDTEAHVFSSQSWGFAAQKQSKVLSGLTASRLVNTQAANQEVSGLHLGTGTPFPQDSASKSCFQRISVGSLEEITHTKTAAAALRVPCVLGAWSPVLLVSKLLTNFQSTKHWLKPSSYNQQSENKTLQLILGLGL